MPRRGPRPPGWPTEWGSSRLKTGRHSSSVSLLRNRDFLRFFGAQAISMFGDRMVPIALAFAVLQLGGSATEVGTVLAMRALPLIACLLIGGVVADRSSRRAV